MTNKDDNIISNAQKNDVQKDVLNFVEYLKANELSVNGAEVSYKGNAVCYMHVDSGENYPSPWTIWTEGDYSDEHEDARMKEIAWANINKCGNCGAGCNPGKRKTIFGKEFDNVCSSDMAFYKPDAETLECVKKLLEIRKNALR